MKNSELSIIIPAYNSKNYIGNIIDDLLGQTFRNFEIIIVDDGSVDETRNVIEHYCSKDKRIKYFYKKNGGASSARNIGIEHASCELVSFLDSDDRINCDYVESLLSAYRISNADIVCFKIREKSNPNKAKTFSKLISGKDKVLDCFLNEEMGIGPTSKIFKKELLNRDCFNERLVINEDRLFLYNYILNCSSAYISSKEIYIVNPRFDSISHSTPYKKIANDLFYVQNLIYDGCEKKRSNLPHFKNQNIKNYLFIYKNYLNAFHFKKDVFDSTILNNLKIILEKEKEENGIVCLKCKIELFLYLHFNKFYVYLLEMYYKKKNSQR